MGSASIGVVRGEDSCRWAKKAQPDTAMSNIVAVPRRLLRVGVERDSFVVVSGAPSFSGGEERGMA